MVELPSAMLTWQDVTRLYSDCLPAQNSTLDTDMPSIGRELFVSFMTTRRIVS